MAVMGPTAWGVEHLSVRERYEKALNAGVDQFGGQFNAQYIGGLVRDGSIPAARIDASVRRILRLKFELGLFDNPYVDADEVQNKTGTAEFNLAGLDAQRKSVVLLKNEANTLPVAGRPKLYVENVRPEVAGQYGDIVATPAEADLAILRLETPHEKPRGRGIPGALIPPRGSGFQVAGKGAHSGHPQHRANGRGHLSGTGRRFPRDRGGSQGPVWHVWRQRRRTDAGCLWAVQVCWKAPGRITLLDGGGACPK